MKTKWQITAKAAWYQKELEADDKEDMGKFFWNSGFLTALEWVLEAESPTGNQDNIVNPDELGATLKRKLQEYEARYEIDSETLWDGNGDVRIRETAEVANWAVTYRAYQRVSKES